MEFATKPVPLKTGGTVRVQIWDTGKLIFVDFVVVGVFVCGASLVQAID